MTSKKLHTSDWLQSPVRTILSIILSRSLSHVLVVQLSSSLTDTGNKQVTGLRGVY